MGRLADKYSPVTSKRAPSQGRPPASGQRRASAGRNKKKSSSRITRDSSEWHSLPHDDTRGLELALQWDDPGDHPDDPEESMVRRKMRSWKRQAVKRREEASDAQQAAAQHSEAQIAVLEHAQSVETEEYLRHKSLEAKGRLRVAACALRYVSDDSEDNATSQPPQQQQQQQQHCDLQQPQGRDNDTVASPVTTETPLVVPTSPEQHVATMLAAMSPEKQAMHTYIYMDTYIY